jgi:hypothetical protein
MSSLEIGLEVCILLVHTQYGDLHVFHYAAFSLPPPEHIFHHCTARICASLSPSNHGWAHLKGTAKLSKSL